MVVIRTNHDLLTVEDALHSTDLLKVFELVVRTMHEYSIHINDDNLAWNNFLLFGTTCQNLESHSTTHNLTPLFVGFIKKSVSRAPAQPSGAPKSRRPRRLSALLLGLS